MINIYGWILLVLQVLAVGIWLARYGETTKPVKYDGYYFVRSLLSIFLLLKAFGVI